MKLLVRTSILSLAVAGLVAGFAPHRNAVAQNAALSHQVVSGIMPQVPQCHTPQECGFGGSIR